MTSVETIRQSTRNAMAELLDLAKVREGQLFVVGCSTSEIVGKKSALTLTLMWLRSYLTKYTMLLRLKDLTWRFNVVNILIVHLLWNVVR